MNLCEGHLEGHLCGRTAGHGGEHVCASFELCGVTWARVEVIRADDLGPCELGCGYVVRAGSECSECLEEDGVARHLECCDD
jgi:hypothetical protein